LLSTLVALPARAQEAGASGSLSFEGGEGSASASGEGWFGRYSPEPNLVELGLFGGLIWMSDDHNLRAVNDSHQTFKRPALELGLRAAYFPLSFVGAELEGALGPAASAGEENAMLWGMRGHVIGQLPGSRITPFVVAGLGRIGASTDAMGDDGDPAVHVGIGAKLAFTSLLGVRLDLRDNMTGKSPESRGKRGETAHHPEVLLGLSLTLGRSEEKKPEPAAAPSDRDKDGFLDPDDKCPDDKGVAPDGCPVGDRDRDGFLDPDDKCPDHKGVAPDGCPVGDRDKDGFLDPDDKCPDEKGIAPDGCPDKDPDQDGILDPNDKCPTERETKNGFEDDDGCPDQLPEAVKKFSGVIQGIEFDVNKATIRAKSFTVLDEAVKVLTDYPKLRMEISGHTDTDGKRDHNLELSKKRAESVKEYFAKKGIAAERIETRGAGPDEPLADNKTKAGKQKNRRIEFKLVQ
jgi:OOP family OmpA-OmpF porin